LTAACGSSSSRRPRAGTNRSASGRSKLRRCGRPHMRRGCGRARRQTGSPGERHSSARACCTTNSAGWQPAMLRCRSRSPSHPATGVEHAAQVVAELRSREAGRRRRFPGQPQRPPHAEMRPRHGLIMRSRAVLILWAG
jgi:hypothetical protein